MNTKEPLIIALKRDPVILHGKDGGYVGNLGSCGLFIYGHQYPNAQWSMGLFSMEEEDQKELQLLPSRQYSIASSSHMSSRPLDSPLKFGSAVSDQFEAPSLDLQLSTSLSPIQQPKNCLFTGSVWDYSDARAEEAGSTVEALKWQAAEQVRLAAIEKAYAERVKELARREMELAQLEFARARNMWERAREEVEKAERTKERATRKVDSTCMEITCQACRQRFRP